MAQVTTIAADAPPTTLTMHASAVPPSPRRGAILLVEDRDDVRQGLAQLFELHGFLVADAADGESALQHLEAAPEGFALVLLDLMLPGSLSGGDVRARQLADPRTAAIPAIVVSACEPDAVTHSRLRPAAWLEKPFRFDALLAQARRFVIPEASGRFTTD